MTDPPPDRPLGDPALAPVVRVVAQRLEQRGLHATGRVTVTGLDRDARRALGQLLGTHLTRDRVVLDLAQLDAIVRDRLRIAGGLVAAVADALGGPLVDRPLARDQTRRARDEPVAAMRTAVQSWPADRSWAADWIGEVARLALPGRATHPVQTAQRAVHLVDLLVAGGGPTRPTATGYARNELAARECGDAHALDDGTVLAAIVLRGLAKAAAAPPPATPRDRRELWQAFGVDHDQVSTTALTLGVRSRAADALARRLDLAAADADPVHLTARNVARLAPAHLVALPVLVCENPRVLEVAADCGPADAAVVCTMGNPATVVVELLRALAGAGCPLDYHGDFDWAGLAIAGHVAHATGARPWRMGSDDYLAAVAAARGQLTLDGTPTPSPWDPALSEAMRATGLAVHQEALLPDLVTAWLGRSRHHREARSPG